MINWKSSLLIVAALLASFSFADLRRESLLSAKSAAISQAKEQIGVRYLFGGAEPKRGFDCSGLIQYVYKNVGINTPRNTAGMYEQFKKTTTPEPGDIVFFIINGQSVSHAGIYLGGNKMIHAARTGKTVEITRIDTPYWQKRFYGFGKI